MKKQFEVLLSRTETRIYRLCVAAEYRGEAIRKAMSQAGEIDFESKPRTLVYDVEEATELEAKP